ncbi:MAG: hypothetical protein A4E51_01716 [Methanosaeta sp. PtaU1.Bin055]|nr:MAG: hypothetical protein A4E51_01716 [Methanosaeta sp. PtaU1.Bin055]
MKGKFVLAVKIYFVSKLIGVRNPIQLLLYMLKS